VPTEHGQRYVLSSLHQTDGGDHWAPCPVADR
jgi:hypothetical protein